jgi:hypothetical protein
VAPPQPSSSDTTPAAASEAAEAFEPPELNELQRRVLDDLRRDGVAIFPFRELFGDELWEAAAADIAPFMREAAEAPPAVSEDEETVIRRFYDRAQRFEKDGAMTFSIDDPWIRIAGSNLAVDVANAYRGLATKLFYLDNWYTVPNRDAAERMGSQRWHRDPEEPHVVKLFVYFTHVDEEAGPLQYVRSSAEGGRYGDLWPRGTKSHPPEGELEAAVDPDDILTVAVPAGTAVFCDTGGFHRGGYARTSPRALAVATYLRPNWWMKPGKKKSKRGKRRYHVDFQGREATLPPQVRFALT